VVNPRQVRCARQADWGAPRSMQACVRACVLIGRSMPHLKVVREALQPCALPRREAAGVEGGLPRHELRGPTGARVLPVVGDDRVGDGIAPSHGWRAPPPLPHTRPHAVVS
jgi:hypothetical protein